MTSGIGFDLMQAASATEWIDLPAAPALPWLLVRAGLRRGRRGQTLPTFGFRSQVEVAPGRLARYRELCGFTADGLLPATFPHVLAFPLQMRLLTDARFPFPAIGLVHLENSIRVLRPLGGLGPFSLSVAAKDLRPHAKGVVFSVVARLEDQLGLLWEGDSRLLYRGLRLDGAPPQPILPAELAVQEVASWPAPANIGRRYARVAGDYNPIHLSRLSARLFGFPRAIAHGLWNKARAVAALHEHLPPTTPYAIHVRFQKPVLLPGQVQLLASEPAPRGQFELRSRDGTPHMRGYWQAGESSPTGLASGEDM